MHHKIIIALLVTTILLTGTNLVLSFAGIESSKQINPPVADDIFLDEEESELSVTSTDIRKYEDSIGLSFDYPDGWHVYSTRYFDDPNRINPNIQIYLSPDPIIVTSPTNTGLRYTFRISLIDEGEAIKADVEGLPEWQKSGQDTVVINGKEFETISILTDMRDSRVSYETPFHEIAYVYGSKYGYRIERIGSDAGQNFTEWNLLLKSIRID